MPQARTKSELLQGAQSGEGKQRGTRINNTVFNTITNTEQYNVKHTMCLWSLSRSLDWKYDNNRAKKPLQGAEE